MIEQSFNSNSFVGINSNTQSEKISRLGGLNRITLIIAMLDEAQPIIEALHLKETSLKSDFTTIKKYTGKLADLEISLYINGKDKISGVDRVGTECATLTTYLAATEEATDLIINAGTAGGFKSANAVIGDIFLADNEVYFHDHRIPIPGFSEYGEGKLPVLQTVKLSKVLGAKKGVLSTGNSLDYSDRELEKMRNFNCAIKDMEGAAVARVARDLRIPFIALKSITDLVDDHQTTAEVFVSNLKVATDNLKDGVVRLLNYASRVRSLDEL